MHSLKRTECYIYLNIISVAQKYTNVCTYKNQNHLKNQKSGQIGLRKSLFDMFPCRFGVIILLMFRQHLSVTLRIAQCSKNRKK